MKPEGLTNKKCFISYQLLVHLLLKKKTKKTSLGH